MALVIFLLLAFLPFAAMAATVERPPNIVFVMVDNLGYADIGPYGQRQIHTPHLDRMAREGIRFTDAYSGALVCAPARSVLMTGQHTGHTRVRANISKVDGIRDQNNVLRVPLEADDITIAEVLKTRGYTTGLSGKWGLGEPGSSGEPNRQGFDEWMGFLNQNHAHSHYPDYLWRNREKVPIPENRDGKRGRHGHDLFTEYALDFIRRHHEGPFYLHLAYITPHPEYLVPSLGDYADKPWTQDEKAYAAMVGMIDRDMGRLFTQLKDLGIDDRTVVFFCSDNGGWNGTGRFDSNHGLRGEFGVMYEGGLRVPMLVRWPGKTPAGIVSDLPWSFADVLPTLAELAGAKPPAAIDGVSVLPAIVGHRQELDRMLYWEHYAPKAFEQATRWGRWKAIRADRDPATFELYDLAADPLEQRNVAANNRSVVDRISAFMAEAHVPSRYWPLPPSVKKSTDASTPLRDLATDGNLADPNDAELKSFLAPIPAPSPAELVRTFDLNPGFQIDVVAAEPLIRSPIAAAFDEDGNLYVAEMRDYPYNGNEPVKVSWQNKRPKSDGRPIGAIRLLKDRDGDGRFEESSVFADHLLWAGGIQPWKGGVFVASPPDIWYLKDTDGDGRADIREKVFTGFGIENQQGLVNSLLFALDHHIYGSTSVNGGEIRPGDNPTAPPISVRGRDFRFDPVSSRFEPETGTRQFGMSFDDWGNRFLCTQGAPNYHAVLPLRYLERNPYFTPRETIAATNATPTPINRISPIERWRHIRSSRRIAAREKTPESVGVSHQVVDAGAGVTIYRGGAYPESYYGNAFIGDSVGNLVHRRALAPSGATFSSTPADPGREFLRSRSAWFRPVNFVNAPDGTLYCIDMAREHSETIHIPPDVEKFMDLTSGVDKGRIFRIAPTGYRAPPPPRLGRATSAELVAALESPHGWWRDTAHRLLYERQDKSAAPGLVALAAHGASPQARVNALWSLEGLGSLDDAIILTALTAQHPGVRRNAVQLAESRLETSAALRQAVEALIEDPDSHVRLQVAFSVGETRQWRQAPLLARIVRENREDPWILSAALSSATECGGELLAVLAPDALVDGDTLRQICVFVGARNRPDDVGRAVDAIAALPPARALPLAASLGEGLERANATLHAADAAGRLTALLMSAPQIAANSAQPNASRMAATQALSLLPYDEAAPALTAILDAASSASLRNAAITILERFRDPRVGPTLLDAYPRLDAAGRTRALAALVGRPERLDSLWIGLEREVVRAVDLSTSQVNLLRKHRDPRVRERAARFFGVANPAAREEVYRSFLPALELSGSRDRGKTQFETRCATCHTCGGVGVEFGPDLSGAATGGAAKLLSSIVDPNRDVAPQFVLYTLETKEGETIGGLLKDQTATTITLRQPGGGETTIARSRVASTKSLGQSMMPEGLEAGLSAQDMADLLAFLTAVGPKASP